MHSARSRTVILCFWVALFSASLQAQEVKAPDEALAKDLELLQGKWELFHGTEVPFHSTKEIKGNQETVRRYDAKTGKLIREHTVEFALARSGEVRVFTFYPVGGDPKQGGSFVYKLDGDKFYDIPGLLQGETYRNYQDSPQLWLWKKVKADAAAKPDEPVRPPLATIDPELRISRSR